MNKPKQKNIDKAKWWDEPLTLVEGCTPISPGCKHCWSAGILGRFSPASEFIVSGKNPQFNGTISYRWDRVDKPNSKTEPTVYAVWNDLFHPHVTNDFIAAAFNMMFWNERHTFIILTKRPARMLDFIVKHDIKPGEYANVIFGTTTENQEMFDVRAPILKQIPAAYRMLSVEPMLGPINMGKLGRNIDWVIIGAESKGFHPGRECRLEWVQSAVIQAKKAGARVFVKQLHLKGRLVKDINEFPESLRLREFPEAIHEN